MAMEIGEAQFASLLADIETLKAGSTGGGFAKGFLQSGDLVWFDLQPGVNMLYPYEELIPLIRDLPRVAGEGGTSTNWKEVNSMDTTGQAGGVSEGNRGGITNVGTASKHANYKGMGFEQNVSFEARYAGKNLADIMGIASQALLRRLRVYEEQMLIWGNNSLQLGTTGTATVVDGAATGGTISTTPLSVICVALTGEGALGFNVSVANGIKQSITRTNADGSVDTFGGGSAQAGAAGSASVTASHTMRASVTPKVGAVAYAWFWGAAGSEKLGAITQVAGIEIAADAAGTQLASSLAASDNSTNALVPDGIITQMLGTTFGVASNSSITRFANGATTAIGTGLFLTSDNAGGIVEFDAMLQERYINYKVGFDRILCSAIDRPNIVKKILSNVGGASLYRAVTDVGATGDDIVAGKTVGWYHNKFMNNNIKITTHPFVPAGNIIFWSNKVPYTMSSVANILEARVRQDYYMIPWPLRSRKYEIGVYSDEVFANYFTAGFGLICNVGNG